MRVYRDLVAISSMIPLVGRSVRRWRVPVLRCSSGDDAGLIKVWDLCGNRTLDDWLLHPMILPTCRAHPSVVTVSLLIGPLTGRALGSALRGSRRCMLKVLLEVGLQWYRIEYGLRTSPFLPKP